MNAILKTTLVATAVAGTLDITSAFVFASMASVMPGAVLRYVASGPFGDGMRTGGAAEAAAGLAVHYALMFAMAVFYVAAAAAFGSFRERWFLSGPIYGLLIYGVMYWIVVPARFGTYPKTTAWAVGNALFSHIICVGIPIAYIAYRGLAQASAHHSLISRAPLGA